MKASVFAIGDFPFGKKGLSDERLNKMKELFRSQKTTQIQVEFTTQENLKTADAVVCPKDKKLDLVILDMETLEARLGKELSEQEKTLLLRCQGILEKEIPLCDSNFSWDEKMWLANNNFVTIKPIIFISGQEPQDLPSLVKKVHREAGMITFLTGNAKESRAWGIKKGSLAIEAAECVHSDIARGFIKADVMAYEDLVKAGGVHQAKNEGCLHQEGKDYVVKDGDVIEFKFNV